MNELKKFEKNLDKSFFDVPSIFEDSFLPSYNSFMKDMFKKWPKGDFLAPFKTDLKEEPDKFILEAELPGFAKEEIKINLDGDNLTISAEHKTEEKSEEKGKYIRQERYYGSYKRTFDAGAIKIDDIKAEYKDGVLKLELPKKEPTPEKEVKTIEVK